MSKLIFSHHSRTAHSKERWNSYTIMNAIVKGSAVGLYMVTGTTADVLVFKIGMSIVGLVVSKVIEEIGGRIIITGYQNDDESYWQEQGN